MKKALSSLRTYLFALALFIIAFATSFGVFWLTHWLSFESGANEWNWHFIMLAFGTLYLFAGVVIYEYQNGKYRKREGDYENKLPKAEKDRIWGTAMIPIVASVFSILLIGILEIAKGAVINTGGTFPYWL